MHEPGGQRVRRIFPSRAIMWVWKNASVVGLNLRLVKLHSGQWAALKNENLLVDVEFAFLLLCSAF
jgi:hypothetical protein